MKHIIQWLQVRYLGWKMQRAIRDLFKIACIAVAEKDSEALRSIAAGYRQVSIQLDVKALGEIADLLEKDAQRIDQGEFVARYA